MKTQIYKYAKINFLNTFNKIKFKNVLTVQLRKLEFE